MKKKVVIISFALFASNALIAAGMGEKERKIELEENEIVLTIEADPQDIFSATIVKNDRVQFQFNGTKVGPFTLEGVKTRDKVTIFDRKKIGDTHIVAGVIYTAVEKADNKIFIIQFDDQWQSPKILYLGAAQYSLGGGVFVRITKGTEWVKIMGTPNVGTPFEPSKFNVVIYGVKNDQQEQLAAFIYHLATEEWNWVPIYPIGGVGDRISGYETAEINKIKDMKFEKKYMPFGKNRLLVETNGAVTFEAIGVKAGYPTTRTFEFTQWHL